MVETGWNCRETPPSLPAVAAGVLLLLAISPLSAQSGSYHDLTDEGSILDPFQKLLTEPGPSAGSKTGEDVATSTVIAYCADSEGCRVRLVLTSGPFDSGLINSLPAILTRTLFVTPNGIFWSLYASDDAFIQRGSLDALPDEPLLSVETLGGSICAFEEKNDGQGSVSYHLSVELGITDAFVGSATCRLIVSD